MKETTARTGARDIPALSRVRDEKVYSIQQPQLYAIHGLRYG